MANNISIKISADVQQALNGIRSVNQKLDSMIKTAENTKKSFMGLMAGFTVVTSAISTVISAVQKAVDAGAELIRTYSLQEQAERRLQTVLRATQNAVGMSASELFDLADSLSSVTAYSDQEIIAVEQMLAATRKISSEVMPEAIKAVLDMAAATGDDAAGAAKDLAQALADPAGEIESLKEKGIQLSEEQAENIRRVQEQNGVYEAQKLLLKEVAGTYGGMAEAIADTDTGKLKQIKDVWTDIKEGLGEGLLNLIQPALDTLYERLVDIEEFVDYINKQHDKFESVAAIREGEDTDIRDASTEILEMVIRDSPFGKWLASYKSLVPNASAAEIAAQAEIQVGSRRLTQSDVDSYYATLAELAARSAADSIVSYISDGTFDTAAEIESLKSAIEARQERAAAASAAGNEELASRMDRTVEILEDLLREAMKIPENMARVEMAEQQAAVISTLQPAASFLPSSIGPSMTLPGSGASISLLPDNGLGYISDETKLSFKMPESSSWLESWEESKDLVDDLSDSFFSLFDGVTSLMDSFAERSKEALDEVIDKWDEYFEELDRKQERQADSLNAMLASGNISYEDYIEAMNAMDEEREEAEKDAAKEEEAARKKADQIAQAAFVANQANQIAQATMNTALGITSIWADAMTPVWAKATLTGLVAASGTTQIAAIASQQYTPLAAGGITMGPTRTLIGEGNPHELVMPLTEGNLERFGIGGDSSSGVINISISIGAVYSKEALADEIFKGIERAQREGALPKWRYA